MKLSIITATYNSGRTLKTCLQSVAEQHGRDHIEHIIIDGGSTDNTLELAAQFPHVNNVVSEPDNGIYDAFNKGLQLAKGRFIYFLNSDDSFLSPDALNNVLELMNIAENQFVVARVKSKDPASQAVWLQHSRKLQFGSMVFEHPCHQGFFIDTHILREFGGFPAHYRIAADSYIMLKAITALNGVFTDEAVTLFDRGGFSGDLERMELLESELQSIYQAIGVKPLAEHNTWQSQKNFARSKLMMLSLLNNSSLNKQLKGARIVIVGTGQMSVIIAKILKSQHLSLVGFVTTSGSDTECLGLKVYSTSDPLDAEIAISGIEGEHFHELDNKITSVNPGIACLRWYQLYED